jgi:hypothetical protein
MLSEKDSVELGELALNKKRRSKVKKKRSMGAS